MLPPIAPFLSPKSVLRERMKAERKRASAARPDAPRHAAARFLASIPLKADAIVSVYAPIQNELDTAPLVEALRDKGYAVALPVVVQKGTPLVFRRVETADALKPGPLGVPQPDEDAETVIPDIVVAPLLAFSRDGGRLGYGGGYYDTTLGALRQSREVIAVGFAFGAQELETVPMGPQDERLDWIVTEREAIRAG